MTPKVPGDVLAALERHEAVKRVAAVRIVPHPTARQGLGAVAVLTGERLFLLVGAEGSPTSLAQIEHVGHALADLWRMVKRAAEPQAEPVLAEGRTAVELPLTELRKAHVTRDRRTFGLEMTLPLPDPRPPWSMYFELEDGTERDAWVEQIEVLRTAATPRPDGERPYSLYYLTRRLPLPAVKMRGPDGRMRKGVASYGDDGLAFGPLGRPNPLLSFESIDRVQWSDPTTLRAPKLTITAAERDWIIVPRTSDHIDGLLDLARLVAEAAEVQLELSTGDLRTGRIVAWTTAASGAAAALAELFLF